MTKHSRNRPRLVIIGPLPPPRHGVSVSTSLLLASRIVNEAFDVRHLDTSDHRTPDSIGRWDFRNAGLGLMHALRMTPMLLLGHRGTVYLPLSQGSGGFMRDSLFIHLASLMRWKVVVHLRGSEFRELFYDRTGPLMKAWIRITLKRVQSAAVLGECLRPVFADLIPPNRIAVVPNGTPDTGLPTGGRDPNRVLFLSNIRRRKGVVEALEAALLVVAEHPDARFTFAGDSYEDGLVDELKRRAAPAQHQIEFLPAVDEAGKAKLLSSAGVLVFPPRLPEGHPRVVLEAMASGMPIVTTARGAIPETVRDGLDGFVLDEPDPHRIAECISRLLADHELQHQMGRQARERYLERFTQEQADARLTSWLGAATSPNGS